MTYANESSRPNLYGDLSDPRYRHLPRLSQPMSLSSVLNHSSAATLPGIAELDLPSSPSQERSHEWRPYSPYAEHQSSPTFSATSAEEPSSPISPISSRRYATSPSYTTVSTSSWSISAPIALARQDSPHIAGLSIRDDRHEYDLEEQFAILYLRLQTKSNQRRWRDMVNAKWPHLFPPGEPRRPAVPVPSGKILSPMYVHRGFGGLQCRYYRLRGQLGIGRVRDSQDLTPEQKVKALRKIEADLAEHWYYSLMPNEIHAVGLRPNMDVNSSSNMRRIKAAYRRHSPFWQLLEEIPNVEHYD